MNSLVLKRAKFFTWAIAIISIISTLIIKFSPKSIIYFYFYPPFINEGEFWRFISPCFIHFSNFHIISNLLVWFLFASTFDVLERKWKLPLIFIISALSSNIASFWAYGYQFGGLSGVIFALVGYVWVFNFYVKDSPYKRYIPRDLIIFLIAYMLFCFTGLLGEIGNISHLAGFITGSFLAFLSSLKFRKKI